METSLRIKQKVIDAISNIPETELVKFSDWDSVKQQNITAHQVAVFVFGQTVKGLIVDFERVAVNETGCRWVRGVTASALAKAYVALVKRRRVPGGIIHFFPSDLSYKNEAWLLEEWHGTFNKYAGGFKEGTFIRIMDGKCLAIRATSINRNDISVEIVK